MVAHANVSHTRNISDHQNKHKKSQRIVRRRYSGKLNQMFVEKKTGSFAYWYFADLFFAVICSLLTDSQIARENVQADTVNKIS